MSGSYPEDVSSNLTTATIDNRGLRRLSVDRGWQSPTLVLGVVATQELPNLLSWVRFLEDQLDKAKSLVIQMNRSTNRGVVKWYHASFGWMWWLFDSAHPDFYN